MEFVDSSVDDWLIHYHKGKPCIAMPLIDSEIAKTMLPVDQWILEMFPVRKGIDEMRILIPLSSVEQLSLLRRKAMRKKSTNKRAVASPAKKRKAPLSKQLAPPPVKKRKTGSKISRVKLKKETTPDRKRD